MKKEENKKENFNQIENESITLLKFVSKSSMFSRRNSFDKIMSGSIKVNDQICKEPSYKIKENDVISLDNNRLYLNKLIYIALNKPRGYICSNTDEHAPRKAIDLLSQDIKERLFSVGRLDKNSEGLILFTNDGEFANKLMHPKNSVNKVYIVSLDSNLSADQMQQIKNGIKSRGETLNVAKIDFLSGSKYSLTLMEGKNREIRRIFEHFSIRVKRLKRVSIGNLKLKGLSLGSWRYLTEFEVNSLKNM